LPAGFEESAAGDAATGLRLLADTSQFNQLPLVEPMLEQTLAALERELLGTEAMFDLQVENVQALSQSYLDFLLPGLLAMTLMQLSVAGSGYNVVEFRRKGILKRLFVTPLRPGDFVAAIVAARLGIVLIQLSVLLAFALLVLDVNMVGNLAEFYLVAMLASIVFLNIGFCIGSMAKTQQAIMAIGNVVIFPQIVLSGVFYPIDAMPGLVQPLAQVLPLFRRVCASRHRRGRCVPRRNRAEPAGHGGMARGRLRARHPNVRLEGRRQLGCSRRSGRCAYNPGAIALYWPCLPRLCSVLRVRGMNWAMRCVLMAACARSVLRVAAMWVRRFAIWRG